VNVHIPLSSPRAVRPHRATTRSGQGSWGQPIEQSLGLLQIGRVEAFAEPAVDRREKIAGLGAFPVITPELGEAGGGAELQQFRTLVGRYPPRYEKILLCLTLIPRSRSKAQFSSQPIKFGFDPTLPGLIQDGKCLFQRCPRHLDVLAGRGGEIACQSGNAPFAAVLRYSWMPLSMRETLSSLPSPILQFL
jgi:hypothetical protein